MTSWWAQWRLKSPASRLFTQPFIQGADPRNMKAPRHWPVTGEFHAQKARYAEMFPFDDVIFTLQFCYYSLSFACLDSGAVYCVRVIM